MASLLDSNNMDYHDVFGYFDDADVEVYRKLYSMVPRGGETAELGCFFGRSICSVADIILERDLLVFCVDTFKGTPGIEAPWFESYKDRDIKAEFIANLTKFGLWPNVACVFEGTTDEAANVTPDDLDLVFIDADHSYKSVRADIANWLPKVKKGGVLAGDDFPFPDVKRAVKEIFKDDFRVEASIWIVEKK